MDGSELIQAIDKIYFENEADFNLDHLTNTLPANLTSDYLLEYKRRLEKLLSAVTKKVSELILSHQPAYVDELKRIADLQESITYSIRACTQGRACLRFIKDGTAKNGVTIIEHHRKRDLLINRASALFEAYHKSSVEKLEMFFKNEPWEAVPVKTDFKLVQLKEFSFLRGESNVEEISLSSDSDEDLEEEFFEDEIQSNGPVLTNSSLNVLRMIGRYVLMMRTLRPIAYTILGGIYHLLDQYTIAAYKRFAPNLEIRAVIRSVRENLMGQGVPNLTSLSEYRIDPKKAVAIESLIFLVNQLWNLQEYLESLIPAEMRIKLKEEFSQNPSMVPNFLKARAEVSSRSK